MKRSGMPSPRTSAEGTEVGAACALYVRGQEVVNIWAGVADPATAQPWDDRTAAMVYSTTKGVTAICANLLAQQGQGWTSTDP